MNEALEKRLIDALADREKAGCLRRLSIRSESEGVLDLSNNDYLRLSTHPVVVGAAESALERYGASSSSSPLVTGYTEEHDSFLRYAKRWHGFSNGVVWNSGYAANRSVLGLLPKKGDLVLADRLIHNSMIAGVLDSGAQLLRYRHCCLEHLEDLLRIHSEKRQVFVVTESVFSMDGDYPDLAGIAGLKERYPFFWVVDEAHAVGWYGPLGNGLAASQRCQADVDLLVGTLGKGLGSTGAYTLFHTSVLESYFHNFAPEFIYSTYLSPACMAAGSAAMGVACGVDRLRLHESSRRFRSALRGKGFEVPEGESPIVPLVLGGSGLTMKMGEALRRRGVIVGSIRPPTVAEGTARLRISLNSELCERRMDWVVETIWEEWLALCG